jgi:hypothetical protein
LTALILDFGYICKKCTATKKTGARASSQKAGHDERKAEQEKEFIL